MSNSKRVVSFFLCLSLFLCFPVFFLSVRSFGSYDENLINDNLTQWDKIDVVGSSSVTSSSSGYKILLNQPSFSLYYQIPEFLISGHTYDFSFCLVESSGFIENDFNGFSFGFFPDTSLTASDSDNVVIPFERLNKSDSYVFNYSFVANDGLNNVVSFTLSGDSGTYVIIKNVTLIDVTLSQHQELLDNQNQNAQDIQDNADENTNKIGGWLSDLGDKIKDIFYIDYILPADWETGSISGTAGSDSSSTEYYCRSSFIDIPDYFGSYLINLKRFYRLRVYKYDLNHNYLEYFQFLGADILNNPYELDPGYSYRLVVVSDSTWGVPDPFTMPNYTYVQQKVFFVTALVNQLKVLLRNLFVPTEQDLTSFKDNMQNLFADKLGFIYSAGDFLGNVLDSLSDLFSGNYLDGSMIITLPALSFNFLGFSIHLWDDTSINLSTLISGTAGISILYNIYKVMLHVFFITVLVGYAERIYKGVLHST